MGETTYTISQAAKLVGVETYVLRFWEEELLLDIKRSEKGYRYYTNEDIRLLQKVKEWKKTYALKDIRAMIGKSDQRQEEFLSIMERLVENILQERKSPESSFKSLDKAIRRHQESRKMIAAASEPQKKSSRKKNRKKKMKKENLKSDSKNTSLNI